MKKFSSLSMVFVGSMLLATSIQAQQTATSKTPVTKSSAQLQIANPVPPTTEKATLSKQDGNASLVYYNYKGITNLEEAKAAWIKDNPETYKKMIEASGSRKTAAPSSSTTK